MNQFKTYIKSPERILVGPKFWGKVAPFEEIDYERFGWSLVGLKLEGGLTVSLVCPDPADPSNPKVGQNLSLGLGDRIAFVGDQPMVLEPEELAGYEPGPPEVWNPSRETEKAAREAIKASRGRIAPIDAMADALNYTFTGLSPELRRKFGQPLRGDDHPESRVDTRRCVYMSTDTDRLAIRIPADMDRVEAWKAIKLVADRQFLDALCGGES